MFVASPLSIESETHRDLEDTSHPHCPLVEYRRYSSMTHPTHIPSGLPGEEPTNATPTSVERDQYVPSGPAATKLRRLILILVVGLSLCGAAWLICAPLDQVASNVIVDDAYYYIVPAQHLVAGHGYCFDGVKRTNGVQPLWAAIVVAIVALFPQNVAVIYILVLLSGLLWFGAGAVLYRAFL